jgi:L-threonylcarbamoyladenylate synthase
VKTERCSTSDPQAIDRALAVLRVGGLVVMPTDTVYGVGCLAWEGEAVARLFLVKGRPEDRPIPILLGQANELERVAVNPSVATRRLAEAYWPGPLTLVVQRHPSLPRALGPGSTIGVRVPAHPVAQRLLTAAGPMAVTSANLSGKPPATSAMDAESALAGWVELILDDGPSPGGQSSTVADCTQDPPVILRPGPITQSDLAQALA